MGKKVKIVLAVDQTILREGLRALLSFDANFKIVGEADDSLKAVDCVEKLEPDLLLMDPSMTRMSGIEAIKKIKKRYPETKIIVLTAHKNEDYISATLQAGVDGYVLKEVTCDELVMAIKTVMLGEFYFSSGASGKVINGYLKRKNNRESFTAWDTLSQREREVLIFIVEGYKNKEIAKELRISIKTVEKHRDNLMRKLDLHNTAAITIYAMEKGLVKPKI